MDQQTQQTLTDEQRAILRIDNTNAFKARALPEKYRPAIPPSGAQLLPTKRVRFIESGAEAVINTADFDATRHEELGAPSSAKAAPKARALTGLTVAQLRALAEQHEVELEDGAKKGDIVAALEAAGVAAE